MGLGIVLAGWLATTVAAGAGQFVPVLVSTEWVAAHLDDPGVLLVQVEMGHEAGSGGYLPGAVALDYHAIEDSSGLPVELPPIDTLVRVFESIGVSHDKHVVLYGPAPAHLAARAYVTLEVLGHQRISVMDGGIGAWRAEGRPLARTATAPTVARFEPRVRTDIVVEADWIRDRLDDPGIAVIDARPAAQFAGGSARGLREGHVPGAGNVFYGDLVESEQVHRLKLEARAMLEAAGAAPGTTIVSYCQIGMRASYNYVVARHLGYDVKFYDGSWADWGARSDLPTESAPRR